MGFSELLSYKKMWFCTFDNTLDTSTAEGTSINDGSQTKNFLFVPQTCYTSSGSEQPYRFSTSNIEITYTDSEGAHTATANITGYKFESGMTYTFKLFGYAPENEYVDFQNWESPSDSGSSNMVSYYSDSDEDSAPVYIWSGRWDGRTGKGENYTPTYVDGAVGTLDFCPVINGNFERKA